MITNVLLAILFVLSVSCVNIGSYMLHGLPALLVSLGVSGVLIAQILDKQLP